MSFCCGLRTVHRTLAASRCRRRLNWFPVTTLDVQQKALISSAINFQARKKLSSHSNRAVEGCPIPSSMQIAPRRILWILLGRFEFRPKAIASNSPKQNKRTLNTHTSVAVQRVLCVSLGELNKHRKWDRKRLGDLNRLDHFAQT